MAYPALLFVRTRDAPRAGWVRLASALGLVLVLAGLGFGLYAAWMAVAVANDPSAAEELGGLVVTFNDAVVSWVVSWVVGLPVHLAAEAWLRRRG